MVRWSAEIARGRGLLCLDNLQRWLQERESSALMG